MKNTCLAVENSGSSNDNRESLGRTNIGAQIVYDFQEKDGRRIMDLAPVGRPANLILESPEKLSVHDGELAIKGKGFLRPADRTIKLHRAVTWTNELSVEVWLKAAQLQQSGPARIVSFSRNGSLRNFTLGQDGDRFDFRLRTTRTSDNGIPSVSTPAKSVTQDWMHVVFTRESSGLSRIFVNGKMVVQKSVPGDYSNWDPNYRLIIGNEHSGDRTWLGSLRWVAIFNRALSPDEVRRNHAAGDNIVAPEPETRPAAGHFFTKQVAPILARHCLECHDSISANGELDLSHFAAAIKGGESGPAIVPGKPDESPLWLSVESDEMPQDRPALTATEKQALRKWIADGGKYSVDRVDPIVFMRSRELNRRLIRRLTVDEYVAAVQAAVEVEIRPEAMKILPPDLRADGFNNTSYNLNVDLKHIESYATLAEQIVGKLDVGQFRTRFFKQSPNDESGWRQLIRGMGQWILRGPLTTAEVNGYLLIAETVQNSGGSVDESAGYLIQAMLQSPRFVYLIEQQRGDGTFWPVSSFELAARVSLMLWGTPPDLELFKLASSGELSQPAVFDRQVQRMLNDPRAIKRSRQFLSQWLNLPRLDNMRPDEKKFPKWDPQLAEDMKTESWLFFHEVVWKEKRDVGHLFNSRFSFLNQRLADHYRISTPKRLDEGKLTRVGLDESSQRAGLLTQGSVLTVGGDEASMVARGLFILDDVLRGIVKDPPPCVDTTPVPTKTGLTQRSIAEQRIADSNCGGCHAKFEPLAFGLEPFDGLGRFHLKDEHGNQLRSDGKIAIPGSSETATYQSARKLMDLLAASERSRETLVWKLTQFSIGRPLGPDDVKVMESIVAEAKSNHWTYPSILTAIVKSDLVQKKLTEPYPEAERK